MYTLGQNGTGNKGKRTAIVTGHGSLINTDTLNKLAKKKHITNTLMLSMIDIAKENGEPEKAKGYWNAYYCQNNLVSADGRIYGNYCKTRYCNVCNGIRKADLINKYYPTLKSWPSAYMVTLTVRNVKASKLRAIISNMLATLRKINEKHRKQYARGTGIRLVGVRSLECTFNPLNKTYHPHFHLIVQTKQMAEIIRKEWQDRARPGWVSPKGQHVAPLLSHKAAVMEVIKYGAKIITLPKEQNNNPKHSPMIYVAALDQIYTAMDGRRLFDRFGFNAEKKVKEKTSPRLVEAFNEYEYDTKKSDWTDTSTGKGLSEFVPSHSLNALLSTNINSKLY